MKDFLNIEEDFSKNKSTRQIESEISDIIVERFYEKLKAKKNDKIKEIYKKSLKSFQTFEIKKNVRSFNALDSASHQNSQPRDKFKIHIEKEDLQTPILSERENSLAYIPIKIDQNKKFLIPNSNYEAERKLPSSNCLHVNFERKTDRSKTIQPRKSQILLELPFKIDL